jgi:hypothetical protein
MTPKTPNSQELGIDLTDDTGEFPVDLNSEHHGTHVSGIATGRWMMETYPDSDVAKTINSHLRLLVIKMFRGEEPTDASKIPEAVIKGNAIHPAVYNLSFTSNNRESLKSYFSNTNLEKSRQPAIRGCCRKYTRGYRGNNQILPGFPVSGGP